MIGMSPGVAPSDVSGVYALIALISDAKAAKKRLDELQHVVAEANEKLVAAEEAAANAALSETVATAERAAAKRIADESLSDGTKLVELAASDRNVAVRARAEAKRLGEEAEARIVVADEREALVAQHATDVTAALAVREAAITERESAITEREADVARKAAEYDEKAAAFKRIVG